MAKKKLDDSSDNKIVNSIIAVLDNYQSSKNTPFPGDGEMEKIIKNQLPSELKNWFGGLLHEGSIGKGNWAAIPWVASMDKDLTTTVSKSVYLVLLFCADGSGVYLTMAQGTGGINNPVKKGNYSVRREKIFNVINPSSDLLMEKGPLSKGALKAGNNPRAKAYENSVIMWKYYSRDELSNMANASIMDIYHRLSSFYVGVKDFIDEDLDDNQNEVFTSGCDKYIEHCNTSNWLVNEKYKFNFSQWVSEYIDFNSQTDKEILLLAKKSQEEQYHEQSNAIGVNFILTEKRYKDDFITINDISYLRKLIEQGYDEKEPSLPHDMTYPKISAWVSCFNPSEYIAYASSELQLGLSHIAGLGEKYPKKGFKAFQFAQTLLHQIKSLLMDRDDLIDLYKDHLNHNELTDLDWAWITQDFNLFITREIAVEDEKDLAETIQKPPRYWLFAPGRNASKWDEFYKEGIMAIGWDELGDFNDYNSRDEIVDDMREKYGKPSSSFKNDSLCCFDFANTINKGDIIICKKGRQSYIGYGIVTSDYFYDNSKDDYHHIRQVEWIKRGNWQESWPIVLKTLTDITKYPDYVNRLKELLGMQTDKQAYSIEDATSDLFLSTEDFRQYLQLLKAKKNIVLQGPPGVGKTFVSKRLAYSLLGEKNDSKIEMIQFHQSYSYEDFIQGFRPKEEGGFKLSNGIFYNLCKKAESNPDSKYVLIIDEINRGNLSKIFGELLMLIEADKRGNDYELSLTYSPEEKFSAPENLFLIGTMNTADRSIAMVDYALRRRFSFIPLSPEFNKKFKDTLLSAGFNSTLCKNIINRLEALNTEIKSDKNNLGDGYQIGHSYFCPDGNGPYDSSWYNNKIKFEIEPLLKEYWFDEPERVENLVENLTINN